jgi:hypothetical protein
VETDVRFLIGEDFLGHLVVFGHNFLWLGHLHIPVRYQTEIFHNHANRIDFILRVHDFLKRTCEIEPVPTAFETHYEIIQCTCTAAHDFQCSFSGLESCQILGKDAWWKTQFSCMFLDDWRQLGDVDQLAIHGGLGMLGLEEQRFGESEYCEVFYYLLAVVELGWRGIGFWGVILEVKFIDKLFELKDLILFVFSNFIIDTTNTWFINRLC